METTKNIITFLMQHLWIWNMMFAVIIVFFERRDPKSVWAWLMLLFFIPMLGFVFYLLIGQNMRKRKMFRLKEVEDHLSEAIRQQEYQIKNRAFGTRDTEIEEYTDLIMYNLEKSGAMLTNDNDIDIFVDGNEKYNALIEDLKQAKHFIHIQYYIIKNDVLFNRIVEVLAQKAAEGVEVRVLFDAMGCRSVRHSYWRKLNGMGIQTAEFSLRFCEGFSFV